MASRDLKGLTIVIGGDTSNLASALRDVDGELSHLQTNLRTVNSALRLDPSNVDALAQRQALLTDAVAETSRRLEILRDAQRQVDQQIADGVEVDQRAYRNLQSEIIRAEASLADYERQANDTGDASRDAGNAANNAGDDARDSAEGWTVLKGTIADLASKAIQGLLSKIGELGGALWSLDDSTRELRTNMGKVETAFQESGYTIDDAKAAFNDFYAIVADEGQATEAVSHLAKLTDSQKELEEWTTIATGVYATFGSSLPIENLTEAANETAKTSKLTGGLADALNWAGVNEEEFQKKLDATNSEAEREALIRETLTGLYGDAAATYRETNGQIMEANEAQARYNSALAGLGEIIEPLKTAFRNGMATMLEAAANFLKGVDMEAAKASIKDAFDYLQTTVFPAVRTGIQWFIDNKDLVIGGLAGIVAGIAAFKIVSIVQTAVTAFKAFQTATQGLTLAQKALNLVLGANPMARIVTLIAGVVTAIVYLWNNCEAFRNFWIGLWEGIKNALSVAWNAITGVFTGAWNIITGIWNGAASFFGGVWNGIKGAFSAVGNFFSNTFSGAWNAVKNAWSSTKSFFANRWEDIKSAFSKTKDWMTETFSKAWEGVKWAWANPREFFSNIWTGIKNVFSAVDGFFGRAFGSGWTAVKNAFSGVVSFFTGVWNGIKNVFSKVGSVISDAVVKPVKNAINGVLSTAVKVINGFISAINFAIGVINAIPGVNIRKLTQLSVPKLATGAVVRKPMLAEIGEYPGANRNPEIVTPHDILRDTFEETLAKFALRGSDALGKQGGTQRTEAKLDAMLAVLSEYLPHLAKKSGVYLDKRRLIGELLPDIDEGLGEIASKRAVDAI